LRLHVSLIHSYHHLLFNATPPPPIYPLSLHDALPIFAAPIERSQSPSSAKPSPLCGNSRSPTVVPRASRRQTWCLSEPQSTPAKDRKSTRLNPVTIRSRMPSSA